MNSRFFISLEDMPVSDRKKTEVKTRERRIAKAYAPFFLGLLVYFKATFVGLFDCFHTYCEFRKPTYYRCNLSARPLCSVAGKSIHFGVVRAGLGTAWYRPNDVVRYIRKSTRFCP